MALARSGVAGGTSGYARFGPPNDNSGLKSGVVRTALARPAALPHFLLALVREGPSAPKVSYSPWFGPWNEPVADAVLKPMLKWLLPSIPKCMGEISKTVLPELSGVDQTIPGVGESRKKTGWTNRPYRFHAKWRTGADADGEPHRRGERPHLVAHRLVETTNYDPGR